MQSRITPISGSSEAKEAAALYRPARTLELPRLQAQLDVGVDEERRDVPLGRPRQHLVDGNEVPAEHGEARPFDRHNLQQKRTANDADRLRKYLARFGLDWKSVRE